MKDQIKLYLVAIPIGNQEDFTIRAIETLKSVDLIIGEERATTERILKKLGIQNKEIKILNEHNEKTEAHLLFNYILDNSFSAALISEAGTPCIADPGAVLVNIFHDNNLQVIPVPGASSIMCMLMASGLLNNQFKYAGFLSRDKEIRKSELKQLNTEKIPIVILEAPYRMKQVLQDIYTVCGENKMVVFGYKLTQPEEMIIKSKITNVIKKTENLKKGEFVIVLC